VTARQTHPADSQEIDRLNSAIAEKRWFIRLEQEICVDI
jgi:hypothetical protein